MEGLVMPGNVRAAHGPPAAQAATPGAPPPTGNAPAVRPGRAMQDPLHRYPVPGPDSLRFPEAAIYQVDMEAAAAVEPAEVQPQPRNPLVLEGVIVFAYAVLRNRNCAADAPHHHQLLAVIDTMDQPLGRLHICAFHDGGDIAAGVDGQGIGHYAATGRGREPGQIPTVPVTPPPGRHTRSRHLGP